MLLWYIYILLIILNLVVAIVRWQKLRFPIKWLAGLLGWVLIIEILRNVCNEKWKPLLSHISISVELLMQFAYFKLLLHKKKSIFLYVALACYIITLFFTWTHNPSFFFKTHFLDGVFINICITLWSGLFFYELIQKPLQYNINLDGNFWVNCGNILFYPGTLLLFGLNSYLENINPALWANLRPLNYGLNFTLYTLYLIAFIMDKKRKSNLF